MQERELPGQFNWLGLAEAAAFNAREFADKVSARLWPFVAGQAA
jgi:hypothetical protein